MRLFLALKVPPIETVDEKFRELKRTFERKNFDPRWAPYHLFYIPLVELGDHGRGSYLQLYELLKGISLDILPFDLKLAGLWGYPRQEEAEMIWIGVQNSRALQGLHSYLARILGIQEESFIRPHIPLIHFSRKKNVTDMISPFKNRDFGCVNIHEIEFLEKLPNRGGVRIIGSHLLHGEDLSGLGLS